MTLRPTHAALGAVALLALALAGVPLVLRIRAPEDVLRGVVLDARGFGVEGAAAYLFSAREGRLVAETRSDADGDFEFPLEAEEPRVLVEPPAGSGLLAAWSPSAYAGERLALVLHPARPLVVTVRGPDGDALANAEVRVYEARAEPAVLDVAHTDASGRVTLSAPARAHVAALAPEPPHLRRWSFDLDVPSAEGELELALPAASTLVGTVNGPGGPLAGIVVTSSEEGLEGGWNGFTRTDARGRFLLPCSDAPTVVRAVDPSGGHMPARVRLEGAPEARLALDLEPAQPLAVRTTRSGFPLESLVFTWSPRAETWSWGVRSGASGKATLPAGERYSVRAEPLDPAFAPLEAWDAPYGSGALHLEAMPRP